MPERQLCAPGDGQQDDTQQAAGAEVPFGNQDGQGQVRQRMIERLMRGVDGLEPAEGKRECGNGRAAGRNPQEAGVGIGRGREEEIMQPHGHAIGGRNAGNRIDQPVGRVERGNVALGEEGNAQAESIAPEGQLTAGQKTRELFFERSVKPVRVAADGLEPDQQPAHQQPRQADRDDRGTEQPPEGPMHQAGILIAGERPAFCRRPSTAGTSI